jgi:hypothetical protein
MFLSLLTWHEPETILACAGIAVFAREDDRAEEIAAMARKLRTEYGAGVYVIPGEPYEVSSTEIRTLLPQREGRELLPALVYSYIIQKRLYGAKPELAWLRSRADSYLKPKRIPHVRGVEGGGLTLALGISENGIKWDSDGAVVNVVVFSVIPVAVSAFYLRLISNLCESFKKNENLALVKGSKNSAELWKNLVKATRYAVK